MNCDYKIGNTCHSEKSFGESCSRTRTWTCEERKKLKKFQAEKRAEAVAVEEARKTLGVC